MVDRKDIYAAQGSLDLLPIPTVAQQCGIAERTLRVWVDSLRIPTVEIDGKRCVSLRAVADFKQNRQALAVEQLRTEPDETSCLRNRTLG